MLPFQPNLSRAFVRMDVVNVSAKFAVHSPIPEIIAIAVLGWGLRTPNLGEGEAVGTVRKSVGELL